MKKIEQGKIEVFTSKVDAIDKLMQMQGVCQEKSIDDRRIEFSCKKDGKINICFPQGRRENRYGKSKLMTKLNGKVIMQDNKTYITYYTAIDRFDIFTRLFILAIAIVVCLLCFVFVADKIKVLIATIICVAAFVFQLISIEKEDPSSNSNILVDVLKKKIDAINAWDK